MYLKYTFDFGKNLSIIQIQLFAPNPLRSRSISVILIRIVLLLYIKVL